MSAKRPDNLYHFFLKIAADGRTPDHYELLGLSRFTDDATAIRQAGVQRSTELRGWQNSDYYIAANELLGEVVAALLILESPAARAEYDRQLRRPPDREGTPPALPLADTTASPVVPDFIPAEPQDVGSLLEQIAGQETSNDVTKQSTSATSATLPNWTRWGAAGFAVVLLVGVVWFITSKSANRKNAAVTVEQTSPDDPLNMTEGEEPSNNSVTNRPQFEVGKSVDLLKQIEVSRDVVAGYWRFEQEKLLINYVALKESPRLQVPHSLPEEYVLDVTVERTSERDNGFSLGFVTGGRQGMLAIDGFGGLGTADIATALEVIGGALGNKNATAYSPGKRLLPLGEPQSFSIEVRKTGVLVRHNQSTIIDWEGRPEEISLRPTYQIPNRQALMLAAKASFTIHEFTLTPLSETPMPVTATDYDHLATGKWLPLIDATTVLTDPKQMKLTDGILELDRKSMEFPNIVARDVIVRAQVRKISGSHLSIQLRKTTGVGYYGSWYKGGDDFGIGKSGKKPWADVQAGTIGRGFKPDDFIEMTVSVVGDSFALYVEGRQVYSFQDKELDRGMVSLSPFGGKSLFKNVEYQILDADTPTSPNLLPTSAGVATKPSSTPAVVVPSPSVPPKTDYDSIATGKWVRLVDAATKLPDSKSMKFTKGVLELNDTTLTFPQIDARDVILRAKIQKLSGENVGLFVRFKTVGPGYTGHFKTDKEVVTGKGDVSNAWRELKKGGVGRSVSGYFELAFSAVGDKLTLYVDGREIHSYRDSEWVRGAVAIKAHQSKGLFKDVEVMVLDSTATTVNTASAAPTGSDPFQQGTVWTKKSSNRTVTHELAILKRTGNDLEVRYKGSVNVIVANAKATATTIQWSHKDVTKVEKGRAFRGDVKLLGDATHCKLDWEVDSQTKGSADLTLEASPANIGSGVAKASSSTVVTKPAASQTAVTPTAAPLPPAKHVRTLAAGYCMDARVTPDEKFVVTLDLDGQVKLWKLDTGEFIRTVGKHGERADHLALFADGQLVVAGGYSQGVNFWDVSKSDDPLASLPVTGSQGINVEGTADGRHLIVRAAGAVQLYRITVTPSATGSKKAAAKTGLPKSVAAQTLVARATASFGELEIHSLGEMPSSRVMATSPTNPNWIYFGLKSDPTKLCLWDIVKNREVCQFAGLTKDAFWIGLSPDGRRLVSVGGDVPIALIWDAATGKLSQRIPMTSLPAQVVLLSDGHRALNHPSDAPIEEWDLDTPRKLRTIPVQRNRVHKVYCLANGTRIVAASAAGAEIWDLPAPAK